MDNAITTTNTSPITQVVESIKTSFFSLGQSFADFIPKVIVAVIILLIGIILSKIIKGITGKTLQGIKIDELSEKSGIHSTLSKMGIKGNLSVLIPKLLGFLILIFMIKTAADAAGFTDISNCIASIFAFTPKVVTAFIIMLIGMFVAEVIQNTIYNTLDSRGIDYAGTAAKIAFGLAFIIFLTVALTQVGIETELLKDSFKILVAGVAIALALALGLGLKSHAYNIISAVYVRDIYRQGSLIEMDGELLSIKGTGPVTTKLQKDNGEFIVVPNSDLVAKKVKGRIED